MIELVLIVLPLVIAVQAASIIASAWIIRRQRKTITEILDAMELMSKSSIDMAEAFNDERRVCLKLVSEQKEIIDLQRKRIAVYESQKAGSIRWME